MLDITSIVEAVIGLVIALITTFVIPYLKTKLDNEKFEKVKAITKIAVEGAEMLYKGSGQGEQKKAYVAEYLANKGVKLDMDTIEMLIESAVLELKK